MGFWVLRMNVYRISKPPFHSLLLNLLLFLSLFFFFLFLSFFSLCRSAAFLASLGAGSWILNPCGLLGGGFLFQFAWQRLKQHHRLRRRRRHPHPSWRSTRSYILSLFWLPFSSFSFFSLVQCQTPQTHPWPPHFLPRGFSWNPHPLQLRPPQPCTRRKLLNPLILQENNLERRLMRFRAVQTPYPTRW